jgi:hypothetical protein
MNPSVQKRENTSTQKLVKKDPDRIQIDLIKNRMLMKMSSTTTERLKPENNQKTSNIKKQFNLSRTCISRSHINR